MTARPVGRGGVRAGEVAGGGVVAVATILAIVGAAILVFLNPVWIGFEQGRAGATAWTGWSTAEVSQATAGILHDLVIGPPDFAMTVAGAPVLDARERAHMEDARRVFAAFGGAALAAAIVLVAAAVRWRRRAWFWRAVAIGGALLAGSVVMLGVFFTISFDTAFELFHRLLFPAGSYDFDPATARLVQLFPEAFWFETTIAFAVVLVGLSIGVTWFALWRIGRIESRTDGS